MTGDLLAGSEEAPRPGEPRRLQKPFRVSDVLAVLQEIVASSPVQKTKH
jgi:hypothetical protein